ncbi:AraC family transcriptional regulator [Paraburkholderia sp. 2C]
MQFTNAESWTTVMAEGYDVHSTLTRSSLPGCFIKARQAGEIQMTTVRVAWQNISPLVNRFKEVGGEDDYLYCKIVQSGSFDLVSGKNEQSFGPGSVLFVNPDSYFTEIYREPTELLLLRLPKKALRERGGHDAVQQYLAPDIQCPDVRAVGEFVQYFERQAGVVSPYLSDQLSRQCLDMMDTLLTRPGNGADRPRVATAFHAKQTIIRLLGEQRLSVERIAEEIGVSLNQLNRLMKADGLSPMRFVWQMRLERASRLLSSPAHGRVSIKEVAYRCGFSSEAHFSRAFRSRYSMTPREFLRRSSR